MPPVAMETGFEEQDGPVSVPPAAVAKKPNAYNDSTEAWRRNIRGDKSFVTDLNGSRPDWYWTGKGPDGGCPGMKEDGTITHFPLPNLNSCSRQDVLNYFDNVWTITEVLFSGIQGEEVFYRPPYHNLRHPLIFYYGHPAALYVNKLRVAGILVEPVNAYFESIFETGVDEMSWDDLSKNDMLWPSVREVTEYRRTVYQLVKSVIMNHPCLAKTPITWESPAWALFMAFEHENIHTETSSVLMRELPIECVRKPKWWPEYHASVTPSDMAFMCNFPTNDMIALPGGDVVVGKPLEFPSFGWDNEYGRREFHVREFSASKFLISNGEFLEFVKDGGYRKEQYWTKHGWMWRTFRNAKKPTFWAWAGPQGKMDFKLRLIFEEIILPLALPAVVNLHEAKAYCSWLSEKHGLSGRKEYRLLTEPEHHRLRNVYEADKNGQPLYDPVIELSSEEIRDVHNMNMAFGSECAVNAFAASSNGFCDVFGNVWQWCEDHFAALPDSHGVHVFYDDFSTPCYDGEHSIIMGGSFISTGQLASVFARYHFRPHFFQHAGFRIVSSAFLQTTCMDSPGPHVNNWDPSTTKRKTTDQESLELIGSQALMHYGSPADILGEFHSLIGDIKNLPKRLAQELVDACEAHGVNMGSFLDVGCSVGGHALELAKSFQSVTGIDVDAASIKIAKEMKETGVVAIHLKHEGSLSRTTQLTCGVGKELRNRVTLRQMDPCCIAPDMHGYDAVSIVNLLERCASPKAPLGRALGQAPLVRVGGILLVASTFEWMEDVADKKLWLGGFSDEYGQSISSAEQLKEFITGTAAGVSYRMVNELNVPFVMPKSSRTFSVQVSHVLILQRVK